MFSNEENKTSGKHMICDIKNIKNTVLLNDINKIKNLLDTICYRHDFTVIQSISKEFDPIGLSIIYLLTESHISIHTFPERNYLALDIYTCRSYETNEVYHSIFKYLVEEFAAEENKPIIIDRMF